MSRIKLTDSVMDSLVSMSEGNPGALTAMMDLMKKQNSIDPQSALGELSPIFSFDTHGIYGSSIYVLWSDKCDRDARKTLMLLRSVQLGFLAESRLQELASDQSRQINLSTEEFEDLDKKVCAKLEDFQRVA